MTEDLDVEAMLEAPYMYKKEEAAPENGAQAKDVVMEDEPPVTKKKEERRRSRSRSKGRKRSRSKSRERHRDRKDRDKGKDKDREKDRELKRGDRDRERGGDRRDRDRDRERERERRRSPVRRRSRSRERYGGGGGYRGGGDRWGGGGYRGGRGYHRDRDSEDSRSRRSRSKERNKEVSPVREDPDADTRDARTVFVMQLSQRARERELKEFFSAVGKVRTVKIITDRNSRRSKGVGYVEYDVADSVPLALGLNNQKLLGVPIIVQPSHAEKNRSAGQNVTLQKVNSGPMRLYVGSLHYNITEAMLRGIFEPFGKIDNIQLMMDTDANRSKGYGFITFHDAEDAKRALDQLNGFELAGRPMKVNHVTERNEQGQQTPSFLDSEELDKRGITLNTTGRLQLMAKLAEGTGFQIPAAAAEALHPLSQVPGLGMPGMQVNPTQPTLPPAPAAGMNLQESLQAAQLLAHHSANALAAATASAQQTNMVLGMGAIPDVLSGIPPLGPGLLPEPVPQPPPPPVAQVLAVAPPPPAGAGGPTGAGSTACFMLSNMFDPQAETMFGWETDIRDDVIEECNKHGGVLHIHVDKASPQGHVYVKCPTAPIAMAALNNLHNRWFAGKMITAAYMPVANYHAIFPQAASSTMLLQPSTPRRV